MMPALPDAPLLGEPGRFPSGGSAHWTHATDGVRLRVAHWPGPRGHVMVLPGRTEYIEKYAGVVSDLTHAGWGASVIDWRGQGLSDRLIADPKVGHVSDFAAYQRDLDALIAAARRFAENPVALCHSMGGCIGLRGLMRGWQPAAVVFSSPMWGLPLPNHMQFAARTLGRFSPLVGRAGVYAPGTGPDFSLGAMSFDNNVLTTDRAQFDAAKSHLIQFPQLEIAGPSISWIAAALREMGTLARRLSPDCPAFCAVGSREKIVSVPAIMARMARWPGGEMHHYPGAEHELLIEAPTTRDDFLRRALALFARVTA